MRPLITGLAVMLLGGATPLAAQDVARCAEVAEFCSALERAAALVRSGIAQRGIADPESLERIARLRDLAAVGDRYDRDGSFLLCGEIVAQTCADSVLRAMASLADALQRIEKEPRLESEPDGT